MSAVGSATQAPALKRQSAAQPSPREVEAEKQKKADAEIDISGAVAHIWQARDDRYSEIRAALPADQTPLGAGGKRVEMSYIGG